MKSLCYKSYTIDIEQDCITKGNQELFQYITKDKSGMIIDSSGGYHGINHHKNGLLKNATSFIDNEINQTRKAHFIKVKSWIKNNVPVIERKCYQGV